MRSHPELASRVGANRSRGRPAGFTLIELLIVLAVIGLLLTLVTPRFGSSSLSASLREAVQELADTAAIARSRALISGGDSVLFLDLGTRRYALDGVWRGRLDARLAIAAETAAIESAGPDTAGVRFFADGSSTGGTVRLAAGGRERRLTIDWLTGRAHLDDP